MHSCQNAIQFWLKRIHKDVKGFCEHCVVCRRAKILPQMAATLYYLYTHTVTHSGT
jgi:hypothetical protein